MVGGAHPTRLQGWAKMTSTAYKAPDGTIMQTHWYENIKTGQRVEYKLK